MSARGDILAGLRASESSTVGDATPEQLLDALTAEVEAAGRELPPTSSPAEVEMFLAAHLSPTAHLGYQRALGARVLAAVLAHVSETAAADPGLTVATLVALLDERAGGAPYPEQLIDLGAEALS